MSQRPGPFRLGRTKRHASRHLRRRYGPIASRPKSSNTEVMTDEMAGKPRVWLRSKTKDGVLTTTYTLHLPPRHHRPAWAKRKVSVAVANHASLNVVSLALLAAAHLAYPAITYADHERFIMGHMRDADRASAGLTTVTGTCIPTHGRERLDCYFTSFELWRASTDQQLKEKEQEVEREFQKDPAKVLQGAKEAFCKEPIAPDSRTDPTPRAMTLFGLLKSFCQAPTREGALAIFRSLEAADGKKCRCVVSDWRSTFVRQRDSWVENRGPDGLCGVITISTLVPQDVKRITEPLGPLLWTLHQRTVTTHRSDDPLCANPKNLPLFPNLRDSSVTLRWDAPTKIVECDSYEFTSATDGMINPRRGQPR
jgi:hypothetical protein